MTSNNSGTPPEEILTVVRQAHVEMDEELRKVLRVISVGQGLLILAAPLAWSSGQDDAWVAVWIPMALVAVGGLILKLAASKIRRVKLSLLEPVGERRLLACLKDDLAGTGAAGAQVST